MKACLHEGEEVMYASGEGTFVQLVLKVNSNGGKRGLVVVPPLQLNIIHLLGPGWVCWRLHMNFSVDGSLLG